ncbi:cyclic nucleotide-binding-like protein [Chytriomyces sp. MP71]|nr:cyclic nucleotide-binding-like protein [Chytriomyces sp. MP71]
MAEFWAMHYHYPQYGASKTGNGVTKPAPSIKNYRPTASAILNLEKRTKTLATPKHKTDRPRLPDEWAEREAMLRSYKNAAITPTVAVAETELSTAKFLDTLASRVDLKKIRIGSAGKRALEPRIGQALLKNKFDVSIDDSSRSPGTGIEIGNLMKRTKLVQNHTRIHSPKFVRQKKLSHDRDGRPSSISLPEIQVLDAEQNDDDSHLTVIDYMELVPKQLRNNFDAVITSLKKSFSARSPQETATIKTCLKPLKAFSKITSDLLFSHLSQTFQLLEFAAGHTIFKQGDFGDAWYIILYGAVNICIATDSSMSHPTVVQVNHAGESFGDMALVNRAPRLATVVTKSKTILLKVDKTDFEKVSSFTHFIDKQEIQHFLTRYVPLFQRLSSAGIRSIAEHIIRKKYKDGTIIIAEEECLNDVFIIKTGCCKVSKFLWHLT